MRVTPYGESRPKPKPFHLDIKPVRTIRISKRRELRVYTAESDTEISVGLRKFHADEAGEMQPVGGEFFVFRAQIGELIAALTEAAAAVDISSIPEHPHAN